MIVVSIDGNTIINDGTNYEAVFETWPEGRYGIEPGYVGRQGADPLVGGVTLPQRTEFLRVTLREGSRETLHALLDTRDGTPKTLLISNNDGGNRRYIQFLTGVVRGGRDKSYVFPLHVTDDVFFRAENETAVVWSISSSPATMVINNSGRADAFPRLVLRPTVNKSSTNPYKQFWIVRWRSPRAAANYPVNITAGGLDTRTSSTNFTSATLDDLRVLVNGVEVNFWAVSPNTATTSIWVNLNWQPARAFTLDGALSSSDTDVMVNEAIDNMPANGLLEIGGEVIAYASKNDQLKRFSGCTRGARGSTAGSHIGGQAVTWLQHDIQLTYGASSPTPYSVDDNYKPVFAIANSSNTVWDYEDFGENDELRSGAWAYTNQQRSARYTANRNTDVDPWSEIGLRADTSLSIGRTVSGFWSIYNPCGIIAANFQNGEKYSTNPSRWFALLRSSTNGAAYTDEYTIPAPSTTSTWESWSQNLSSLTAGSLYVSIWLLGMARSSTIHRLEVANVMLTLNSSATPTVAAVAEQGNYTLNATITNVTLGVAVRLTYSMNLDDELELDTDARTVLDLTDSSNQFQALTRLGGPRLNWLPLAPGDNELKFEDADTAGLTLTIYYRRRRRT